MARRGNKYSISKPIEGMYTATQAAEVAGVSRQRLHARRAMGLEPEYVVQNGRVYYPKDSFDKWLHEFQTNPKMRVRGKAKTPDSMKDMYSGGEVAALSGLSMSAFIQYRARGKGPECIAVNRGKKNRYYYPKDSFDKWLAERKK